MSWGIWKAVETKVEKTGEVGGRSQEIGFSKVSQIDLCLQKESKQENADKKLWYHAIEVKKGFMLRKGKIYLFLREKRYVSLLKNNWENGISDPQSHLK